MSIEIKFTGDDPAALAQQILTMGFLISAKAEAKQAEPAPEKKTRTSAKKATPAKEAEDVRGAQSDADTKSDEPKAEKDEPKAEVDAVAAEATPTPASGADEPELTVDGLRKYALQGYLLKQFKDLDAQKAEWARVLGHFEVGAITELPKERYAEFKAYIDERIAEGEQ